jgi:hypothetical protein
MDQNFLTERQAAAQPKTLARWRYIHQGPRVHKFASSVRYKITDLVEFAASCSAGGESTWTPQ